MSDEQGQNAACSTCYGYGMWATRYPSPMGPIDAQDGMSTHPCPECGVSANPMNVAEEKSLKQTLTLVFTDWNPKWREEFLLFDEQQAIFELEQAGLPHYPSGRERHVSFALEQPLTEEEIEWLEGCKRRGLFLRYSTDAAKVEGYAAAQPAEGTQETLTVPEFLKALYPANVHPLEYGLYDTWRRAVGPTELPESMKLPKEMRGKGITTHNITSSKKRRKKV